MAIPSIASRAWREPSVRFLLFGGAIFALHAAFSAEPRAPLSINAAPRADLFEAFAQEHGRAPDAREREALVEGWADEQALLRYAYDLELHRADAVVRRRLVQDVELLLEAEAEPVTEVAMRARYLRDASRFTQPAKRSFEHLFFAGRSEASRARAAAANQALREASDTRPRADPFSGGAQLTGQTRDALASRFDAELADRAFALALDTWSEPLPSPLGFHLLRATEESPAHLRPFEEVRTELQAELEAEQRAHAIAQGTRDLRERYAKGALP